MSIKTQIFRTAIQQPLTARDITILIPKIPLAAVIAQSSTFPTEKWKSCIIRRAGQEVELPTKMQVAGDWTFTLPESIFTLNRFNLLKIMYKKQLFDVYQVLGTVDVSGNIFATLTNLIGNAASLLLTAQTLHDCWIREISPVEFSASDPTKPILWQVTVHYNYITPLLGLL